MVEGQPSGVRARGSALLLWSRRLGAGQFMRLSAQKD